MSEPKRIRLALDQRADDASRQLRRIFETPAPPGGTLASVSVGAIDILDQSDFPAARQKGRALAAVGSEHSEHLTMVQNLYSAYSIGPSSRSARKSIAEFAVKDIPHLMTVENLPLLAGLVSCPPAALNGLGPTRNPGKESLPCLELPPNGL